MASRRHRSILATAAAGLLMLGACSESTPDDASPGTTAPGDTPAEPTTRTTRGVTDTSIKVGGVSYGLYFGDAGLGVEARLKEVNDAGGVHGRTIDLVEVIDDNNEAANGLEAAQRLVERDEVFALLPVMSGAFGGSDYITQNQIPTFGWGVNPAFCDVEVSFGITGCVTDPELRMGSNALGTALEQHFGDTDRTVAFLGEDNDAGRGGLRLLAASVEDKGFDVVFSEASAPPPPDVMGDPSPFVSRLLSADGGDAPDVIYLVSSLSGTSIAAALQAAGYEGMIMTPSYSPLLLNVAGYEGTWVNTQIGMDPSEPANIEMLEAVHAVDPDAQLNLAVAAGYWAADFFIRALEETGEDLTVELLLATLNGGGFTYEVDGVVGPSEWPRNHAEAVPCSALTEVRNNEFVPVMALACGENITIDG